MLEPLTELMGHALKPVAECIKAFRIVEVKNLRKEFHDQDFEKLA